MARLGWQGRDRSRPRPAAFVASAADVDRDSGTPRAAAAGERGRVDPGAGAGLMAAMISVLIATHDDERTLGQALAALVPAAVDGLVREVILADAGSTDDTLAVADDAGARVVRCGGPAAARLAEAARTARSDWLLILDVAVPAPYGWEDAVAAVLNRGSGPGLWWGEAPFLGKKRVQGLLIGRRAFEAGAGLGGARRVKL